MVDSEDIKFALFMSGVWLVIISISAALGSAVGYLVKNLL